jgi:hypothetical protein
VVTEPENADLALVVSAPREATSDNQDNIITNDTAQIVQGLIDRDLPVAVADVARANGADLALMEELNIMGLLPGLAGYAGWNTAGNSIGTALAQGSIYAGLLELGLLDEKQQQLHERCLLTRYVDDWGYQAVVRAELMKIHDLTTTTPLDPALEQQLAKEAGRMLKGFAAQNLEPSFGKVVPVEGVTFPWLRLFEVEFK